MPDHEKHIAVSVRSITWIDYTIGYYKDDFIKEFCSDEAVDICKISINKNGVGFAEIQRDQSKKYKGINYDKLIMFFEKIGI
jgi:hypothetical protein